MENQRKRKRTQAKPVPSPERDSGDENKKRGRPRVDKQDESAADRRRTQIRMAQRAYRQRKESTLDELRKRVSVLNNSLEMMNRALLDCRDSLTTSGVSDFQASTLRDTASRFELIMKEVRNPEAESPTADISPPAMADVPAGFKSSVVAVRNVPSWLDQSTLDGPSRREGAMEVGMGYTMMYPGGLANAQAPTSDGYASMNPNVENMFAPHSRPQPGTEYYDVLRSEVINNGHVPTNPIPPATYSFQESSFARRLHRASIEAAYYLVVSKKKRPKTFDRVFRLSLMSRDEKQLLASLESALGRGPHESLDLDGPRLRVGGAGTHYPRRDAFGSLQPRPLAYELGNIGPQALALLENAVFKNNGAEISVNVAGYEGIWFDPYDVEAYLEEKGIQLDPMSSFAEAEVEICHFSDSDSSASSGNNLETPRSAEMSVIAPFDHEQLSEINRYDRSRAETPQWEDPSFPWVARPDAQTGSWINFVGTQPSKREKSEIDTVGQPWGGMPPTELMQEALVDALNQPGSYGMSNHAGLLKHNQPSRSRHRTKRIIIDIAKFVKVLTLSGVCLGTSAGYRKQDVERALAMASFDA